MRYLSLTLVLITSTAWGSPDTVGPNGIDSKVTGLSGLNVLIGQAEAGRSGKWSYDVPNLSANNTVPFGVYFQNDGGMSPPNNHLVHQHPTYVAGVMIGLPGDYEGVAPDADLNSLAISDIHDDSQVALALNRLALLNGGAAAAINLSFNGREQPFVDEPDGNSHFTQFVDWSARRHDVLYVVGWGNDDTPDDIWKPRDNFNGITVAASQKFMDEDTYRQFAISNTTDLSAGRIDLLAPGLDVEALGWDNTPAPRSGASIAAPHVTGTAALLQQYAQQQMNLPEPNPRFDFDSKRHEVMKAVILNSADKLSSVHGSNRTILDANDNDWLVSEAYSLDFIPLDDQMGAGHLNARRAVEQFSPGEYDPGAVPSIGWDYHTVGGGGAMNEYFFEAGSGFLAATLAWDRRNEHTGGNTYQQGDIFFFQSLLNSLNNLDLYILPAVSNDLADALTASRSTDDSIEHIFFQIPGAGQYKLVVYNNPVGGIGDSQAYGLAWWFGSGSSTAPGDFNGDGSVNAADYVVWRKDPASFGGQQGYDTWRANFGNTSGSGSFASVPEPNSVILLTFCFILLGPRLLRASQLISQRTVTGGGRCSLAARAPLLACPSLLFWPMPCGLKRSSRLPIVLSARQSRRSRC